MAGQAAGRSYTYKATLELFRHLGIKRREELPDYRDAFKKIKEFVEESASTLEEVGVPTENVGKDRDE